MSDEFDSRIDELLALAVFGELSPAEEAELDAALAADAELTADLDADLAVAARIQATHAEAPPASLKADVMAAIDALDADDSEFPTGDSTRETASDSPVVSPMPATSPLGAPDALVAAPPPPPPSDVVDLGAARAKRRSRWQPLVAAAAVVMLVAGGVLVANRRDDTTSFDAIAQADDVQQRTLAGDLGGTLDVVYSPSKDAFVLVGSGIPTLVDAETYQLWFVDDSGAQPIGLFRPDDSGRVEEIYEGLDPSDYVVGVTIEPAAGSEQPTLPIVAAA